MADLRSRLVPQIPEQVLRDAYSFGIDLKYMCKYPKASHNLVLSHLLIESNKAMFWCFSNPAAAG